MTRAVQITYLIPIDDESADFPDMGIAGKGRTEADILEHARELMAELIADEGVQGGEIVEVTNG